MRNIIDAIVTLIQRNNFSLTDNHTGKNRINETGYALEDYIKDIFADTFDCSDSERLDNWSKVFSYLGNNTNPPDIMLKGGDAIEIKNNPMISNACRTAENWTEKDILYVIGVVNNSWLKNLCMIYGQDYCASDECYNRIRQRIC